MIDTHTHIHFPVYDKDREEVIKRARGAGVNPHTKRASGSLAENSARYGVGVNPHTKRTPASLNENSARYGVGVKMICVGTQAASSQAAVELAKKYPGEIWATAGFHPNHFASAWYHDRKEQQEAEREKFDAQRLREIAKNPEVVAIGEFGLDYYRLSSDMRQASREKEDQQEAFEVQIGIAKELDKALMMHCRPSKGTDDAYEEALRILSTYDGLPPRIFHFYVGSLAITKKLVDSGAYFTFGGVITFSRDYDEIIKYIPLDRILLETDAPYVAPEPYRGKRNEPAYIIETAKKMAEIKNVSYEKVSETTTSTARAIFRI